MAGDSFELQAETREFAGKGAARRLRRIADKIPAVVYGAGKSPQSIMLQQKDLLKALSHEAIFSSILTLKIGDKKQKVVLKALQRHHSKPKIVHIDFQRIKASEKLTMNVPLSFVGEEACPGVEEGGGVISHLQTEIEIKCLPADLPENVEVDVSSLQLDQSLHLSDLKLPSGVELAVVELDEEHNVPVVSVHVPKVSKEDLEAEAAEAALAAEAAAESATDGQVDGEKPIEEDEAEKAEGEASGDDTDKKE